MRLFVVIGYPDTKPTSEPFPVYVGTSGAEKLAAMNRSQAQRFVVLDNPLGIRKNNPYCEANRKFAQYRAGRSGPTATSNAPLPGHK